MSNRSLLPSLSARRFSAPNFNARGSRAIAKRYAGLLEEVDNVLLMGDSASDYGLSFANHFARVVLFERDDAHCAQFRARMERGGAFARAARNIIMVDSQAEGEAILRTVAEQFAIIDCGQDAIDEGDVTDTMRQADYLVLPGTASEPERDEALVEELDARGRSHEFNVGNAWDEAPKFTDWQRRSKFKDRMAAQYRAYSIHARHAKAKQFNGW